MKYFFTTLAINEPYISKSIEFHQQLHNRTEHAIFNITTTRKDLKDLNINLEELKTEYPRLHISTIEDLNKVFTFPLDVTGGGFSFNLNLKSLSIKACVESNIEFDHLIFIDGDWHIHDGFAEEKILNLFNEMQIRDIDFVFERPATIGGYRQNNYEDCFFREKAIDYKVFHPLWDEADVVNEQFLVIKNNWKLKVFAQKWEQMLWYTIANNIRNYPDGFEIGIAALESKMTRDYTLIKLLDNCFYFWTKYTNQQHFRF